MVGLKRYSITRVFVLGMVAVATFSSLFIFGLWAFERHRDFKFEAENSRREFLESQKLLISREVDSAVDFANFKRHQLEERVKVSLQTRVLEAHAIASSLYTANIETLGKERTLDLVSEALRPIRFNNGRGYFFAFDLEGTEQLVPVRPDDEETELLNIRDSRDFPIIREMIAMARAETEGFYGYTWAKPGSESYNFSKLSFIKLFEPV